MASITNMNDDRFGKAILQAIKDEIIAIADEEAAAAAERVSKRTKARINEMAVTALSHFSVERFGRDLRITVRHDGTDDNLKR